MIKRIHTIIQASRMHPGRTNFPKKLKYCTLFFARTTPLTKKHKIFIQKPIKNTSNTALPLSFRLPIASAPHALLQCCCERFAQALRCLFSSINVVRGVGTPRVDALDHAVCERTPRGLWQCARQQGERSRGLDSITLYIPHDTSVET